MEIVALVSGSKGNSLFVKSGKTSVLLDVGLSAREIERRLALVGASPEDLSGIVVSHEHNDHIKGVGPLARRFNLPVYITEQTYRAAETMVGILPRVECIDPDAPFEIGVLWFSPFLISHDAVEPLGFSLTDGKRKVGVATDLGMITHLVRENMRGAHVAIVESNHDPDMLMEGPYPWELKQRIKGRRGHLSNPTATKFVQAIYHSGLERVVLAHLSEINNTPKTARQCLIERAGCRLESEQIVVARPDRPVRIW
jgi:phosphoribosyl 1,2-cyclic phosphodiesterase